MACVEQFLLLVVLCGLDGAVEFGVNLLGHGGEGLVEVLGPFVLVEVEVSQCLAGVLELVANLGHCLHVGVNLYAEFVAEYLYKLDGRSRGAAAEPPDVGVDDVHALYDGRQH